MIFALYKIEPRYRGRILCALLVAVILTGSGCVYLRLARLRGQLAEFNKHFDVRERPQPTIIAHEPLFYPQDPIKLTHLEPSRTVETEAGLQQDYIFEKIYEGTARDERNFDFVVNMLYVDGRLREMTLPSQFVGFLTEDALSAIFDGVDDARINPLGQKATWQAPERPERMSTKNEILSYLGVPTREEREEGELVLVYRYALQSGENPQGETEDAAQFVLKLDAETERLLNTDVKFGRIAFTIDFKAQE